MATGYIIGPFRLDADAALLFRGEEPVAIGQRAIAVLRVLLERPGSPVSKDALIKSAWSGLIVEESNLPVQIAALRRVFGEEHGGERWIETMPKYGYRFIGPVRSDNQASIAAAAPTATEVLPLPVQPAVAVLPFQNMSDDPSQEYFADGVVEEIITTLSRFRSLFVIARNSSFTYKGRAVDIKQIGRELGVSFVLEGSVRRSADRVRITAQLIDASTGAHLWADRFDGALADIFDLQDQIARQVVGLLVPKLEHSAIERAKRKPTESLGAYEYYLRGTAAIYRFTIREANVEALQMFRRAIDLDPEFASAYGMAAYCYVKDRTNRWPTDDLARDIAETDRLARHAIRLGSDDALALATSAGALAYVVRDLDTGAACIEQALHVNPNLMWASYFAGFIKSWMGEPEAAVSHLALAMRLSPVDPLMPLMQVAMAHAHFFAGRYGEASSWATAALRGTPRLLPALRIGAAADAFAGQMEPAQKAVDRLLHINPDERVSNLEAIFGPYRRPDDAWRYGEGLRRAGLPE
ncbi:winged helix-turn-helix domain-containing protein [Bradyrhizobium manausense]|uniref:winged helix-turn-helix domain-containing tetratricopeptide repeat protein n=1 Tax=Bradyrhizobium manausense TaxID=989370 RepID=UPI001BA758FE|nr:winged helix-turn-helix domain-containing tetratricopeptide repeat protein [Bradyrhizobium manausense]MBR0834969.1 winged helix-turn-helix domain-containing protein [Bradyrhizobium manausense]